MHIALWHRKKEGCFFEELQIDIHKDVEKNKVQGEAIWFGFSVDLFWAGGWTTDLPRSFQTWMSLWF